MARGPASEPGPSSFPGRLGVAKGAIRHVRRSTRRAASPGAPALGRRVRDVRTVFALLATVAVLVLGSACSGDDDAATTTAAAGATTSSVVTLTTEAGVSPAELGEQILVGAGARQNVAGGGDAEVEITELGARLCTTVALSDWENGTATFRASLAQFFATYGVTEGGEAEDARIQRALLASDYAAPLAVASAEVLCPDLLPAAR